MIDEPISEIDTEPKQDGTMTKQADLASQVLSTFQERPMKGKNLKPEDRMTQNPPDIKKTEKQEAKNPGGIDRTPTVRLERHLMAKALHELHDIAIETSTAHPDNESPALDSRGFPIIKQRRSPEQKAVIDEMLVDVQKMKVNLDRLNEQIRDPENQVDITVDSEETGKHTLPFRTFDLFPPAEGEVDTRIPMIFIGGVASAPDQNTGLSMALALAGKKVIVPTYPERAKGRPDNWRKLVRDNGEGTFRVHEQVFSDAIRQFTTQQGIDQVDLLGHSVGGLLVLGIAAEDNPPVEIHNVISLEPVGFENKNFIRNTFDFAVRQNNLTSANVEDKIKMLVSPGNTNPPPENLDWLLLGQLTGKKVMSPEALAKIRISGECQIYMGNQSPVVDDKPIKKMVEETVQKGMNNSPISAYTIEGGDHAAVVTHALGFVQVLDQQLENPSLNSIIDIQNLSSSAAELMLKEYSSKTV